jgi:phosphate transport system substrate-binding protein
VDKQGSTSLQVVHGRCACGTCRDLFVVALALLVCLAWTSLAGCTSGDTTTTAVVVTSTQLVRPVAATAPSVSPVTQPVTTATTEPAVLAGRLSGAGTTFPAPAYVEWIGAFQAANAGVKINYQSIGSGAGIGQFTDGVVDFGATDIPLTDQELATAERASGAAVLQIPTLLGGIAIVYNLPGVDDLRLDADTIARISLGDITRWDDPELVALNPNAKLPAVEIKTVHRSDSSFSTLSFTSYLSRRSIEWRNRVGSGRTVVWPVGVGSQGSEPPGAVVMQNEYTIGYTELAYYLELDMQAAALKNPAGNFIRPSPDSVAAAARGVESEADLRSFLLDSDDPEAYPLVHATWILAYDVMKDPSKAAILRNFLEWALGDEGSQIASDLGYVTLPAGLVAAALEQVEAIGPQ